LVTYLNNTRSKEISTIAGKEKTTKTKKRPLQKKGGGTPKKTWGISNRRITLKTQDKPSLKKGRLGRAKKMDVT